MNEIIDQRAIELMPAVRLAFPAVISPASPNLANEKQRLSKGQRAALILLLLGFIAFGCLVEMRSAFMQRRMCDLDVYLRGAWAVRTSNDLYNITDDNHWHYNYPPFLAIALVPLADPPPGADRTGMIPFAVTVALWYLFSLACLAIAVHWLVGALEARWQLPANRRRWWALRMFPVLACLVPVGHTLMRGQVNMIVLLLFCGMAAGMLKGQGLGSGLCLAGAICIKLFPAFLLIFPLWQRNWRCLAGCALGLFVGIVVIPLAVFGPAKTLALYQQYTEVLIRPALGTGSDTSRAHELTSGGAADSQSFQAMLRNSLNRDLATRPRQPAGWILGVNYVLGGLLTWLTLWAGRRKASNVVLPLGALILLMLFISPVCHLHYFVFSLPLVIALIFQDFQAHNRIGWRLKLILVVNLMTSIVPNLPWFVFWREVGLATYGAMLLWMVAIVRLWKKTSTMDWKKVPHVWPRLTQFPQVNQRRPKKIEILQAEGVSDRSLTPEYSQAAYAPGSP